MRRASTDDALQGSWGVVAERQERDDEKGARGRHRTAAPASSDAVLLGLILQVGARDELAFKLLYDRCAPRLYGLALMIVRNRESAEDVLQEAFMAIWRSAGDFRVQLSPPMAWMLMIVRSRSLDALRRRASERWDMTQPLDDEDDSRDASASSPLDAAQASQEARALHCCLAALEHKQREAVSLVYLRELSHSELSVRMGIPLGSVKSLVRRGIGKLRASMLAAT